MSAGFDAAALAAELPFLRRYARAVAGGQEGGDALAKAALAGLRAGGFGDTPAEPRLALFSALYREATRAARPVRSPGRGPVGDSAIVASRVAALDGDARHALVLTALEGLSAPEAARVMGKSEAETRELLARGREGLRAQPPTSVLVIEDEPLIALDIAATVERAGHKVLGVAATRADAVELARERPPGLILADIQLADDSSGLDAARDILALQDAPVIFITAFPERLLTGERPEPALLLTKPFDATTLSVAMAQALARPVTQAIPPGAEDRAPAPGAGPG